MAMTELPSSTPHVRIGHRGALVVSCFYGWPNAEAMRQVEQAQRTVAAGFGACVTLTIIPSMTDAQARENPAIVQQAPGDREASLRASAATAESIQSITRAAAMVVLARGVVSIMVSAFMGAFALVNRGKVPLKTFRGLAEALEWLESQPGVLKMPGAQKDVEAWLAERTPSA